MPCYELIMTAFDNSQCYEKGQMMHNWHRYFKQLTKTGLLLPGTHVKVV